LPSCSPTRRISNGTTSHAPEIVGARQNHLGTANVTRIIRWGDLAQRGEVWNRVLASLEYLDIFSRVAEGLPSYLRIEANFSTRRRCCYMIWSCCGMGAKGP
jgi:hypothetical protein